MRLNLTAKTMANENTWIAVCVSPHRAYFHQTTMDGGTRNEYPQLVNKFEHLINFIRDLISGAILTIKSREHAASDAEENARKKFVLYALNRYKVSCTYWVHKTSMPLSSWKNLSFSLFLFVWTANGNEHLPRHKLREALTRVHTKRCVSFVVLFSSYLFEMSVGKL